MSASEQVIADRLYEDIKQVLEEGTEPNNVVAVLQDLFLTADDDGNDSERDAIAEVMDCIVGWTSERATLQAS